MNKPHITLLLDTKASELVLYGDDQQLIRPLPTNEQICGVTCRVWAVETSTAHLRIICGAPIPAADDERESKLFPHIV